MTVHVERVSFPGGSGEQLAGRLDLPAGPPKAYALFAHCFTCSKDLRAASRLAAVLTDLGYGLLRFDFTGLGASEGEFANTDFSSNIDDLVAAADFLRANYRAPQLLVGHSLGGAAVLVAADRVPEVRAVATIGAPSDAGHVANLLGGSLADECQGEDAAVELAGRHFTVRRDFVEDLQQDAVLDAAAGFKGAVLVLHAPLDNVVSIDHAARIFQAARHPKSFVVLDGANHLLTTAADAEYAAATIGTWAGRYLVDESGAVDAPETGAQVLVAETTQGRYLNHVVVGEHRFLADEPISAGGFDAGPNPYDLLASALGACTSMTLRMYAEHKGMEVGRIAVEVSHEKYHPADAAAETENGNAPKRGGKIDRFTRVLRIDGDYDEATRASLLRIADKCPVHRTLHQTSEILTEFE